MLGYRKALLDDRTHPLCRDYEESMFPKGRTKQTNTRFRLEINYFSSERSERSGDTSFQRITFSPKYKSLLLLTVIIKRLETLSGAVLPCALRLVTAAAVTTELGSNNIIHRDNFFVPFHIMNREFVCVCMLYCYWNVNSNYYDQRRYFLPSLPAGENEQ